MARGMLHEGQIKQIIFLFNSILMEGKMKKGILRKIHNNEKGFTLIELMIVVAIIGILAAIAIPQFAKYRQRAFNSASLSDARNTKTEVIGFNAEWQHYPY